jgi:hypothetical protein
MGGGRSAGGRGRGGPNLEERVVVRRAALSKNTRENVIADNDDREVLLLKLWGGLVDGVCNEGSARRPPMRRSIEILNRSTC